MLEVTNGGEILTDTGAVLALTSHWWLPDLQALSAFAGLVLPILGATWLAVQIGIKVYLAFKGELK